MVAFCDAKSTPESAQIGARTFARITQTSCLALCPNYARAAAKAPLCNFREEEKGLHSCKQKRSKAVFSSTRNRRILSLVRLPIPPLSHWKIVVHQAWIMHGSRT